MVVTKDMHDPSRFDLMLDLAWAVISWRPINSSIQTPQNHPRFVDRSHTSCSSRNLFFLSCFLFRVSSSSIYRSWPVNQLGTTSLHRSLGLPHSTRDQSNHPLVSALSIDFLSIIPAQAIIPDEEYKNQDQVANFMTDSLISYRLQTFICLSIRSQVSIRTCHPSIHSTLAHGSYISRFKSILDP